MIAILAGIAAIHLLAIASPGPTFIVVASYATAGNRRAGFLVTFGVLLATLTWAGLAALGFNALIAQFAWLDVGLRILGALYLVYLGVKMIRASWRNAAVDLGRGSEQESGWRAVRAGYVTNISNPKVIAYYASLFGVVIPPGAPTSYFIGAVATALAVSALWWSAVTLFFALPGVQRVYLHLRRKLDALVGGLLIILGGKLLLAR